MEQVSRPGGARGGNLPLDPVPRRRTIIASAPEGEIGQRLDRAPRVAEAAEQLRVADRPDVGRAQQADARKGFLLRKPAHGFLLPTFGSSPARSRLMFSRCSQTTRRAIAASTGTKRS